MPEIYWYFWELRGCSDEYTVPRVYFPKTLARQMPVHRFSKAVSCEFFLCDAAVFRIMERTPEEDTVLAKKNEIIKFRIESPEEPPEDNPSFLIDGSSENVGDVFGVTGGESVTESYQAPVRFEETGSHVVHIIWNTEGENLEEYDSIDEIRSDPNGCVIEWSVYVLDEDSTLDDIRQVIDDITRAGTVIWAEKKLKNLIKDRLSESEEDGSSSEEESTDEFQEVLTNFE